MMFGFGHVLNLKQCCICFKRHQKTSQRSRISSTGTNSVSMQYSFIRDITKVILLNFHFISFSRRTNASKSTTAPSGTEEGDNVQSGAVGKSMNTLRDPVEAGLVSDEKVQRVHDVPGNPEAVQEENPEGLTDDETRNSKTQTTRIQKRKPPAAPNIPGAVQEEKTEITTPNKPENNGTVNEQKPLVVPKTPVNSNKIIPEVKQQPSSVVEIDKSVLKPVSTNEKYRKQGAIRPDVARKPDMATKPNYKPSIPARFPDLILTGDKIEVDKVVTRVHMASQKSGINSTKLKLLR